MSATARKGIVLAGGSGSRLYPLTRAASKQLLPVFDKPMVYYPLSVLMQTGIRDIAIVSSPPVLPAMRTLFGDGHHWGLTLTYIEQPTPDGIAQAYLLAADFLAGGASALILGDNLFFGKGLAGCMSAASKRVGGGTVFACQVSDPERYGVVSFDKAGRVTAITEKPEKPESRFALTGLYFLDGDAPARASRLRPSRRGELEITDLLGCYLNEGLLTVEKLARGFTWLDAGTQESLLAAGGAVRSIEKALNRKIGCPEEIAFRNGWITRKELLTLAAPYLNTRYGSYLKRVANKE
ncbi:MAG: glucose-1-phosphate thymidylyltransferase RfbA [Paracoccaceae bacterium]